MCDNPEKLDAQQWKWVRRGVKVPMVLLVFSMSMLAACCQASTKLFELSFHDRAHASWALITLYFGLASVTAILIVVIVNVTMALYKQVDFVQLFTATSIVMTLIGGLCLFNEIQYYSAGSLSGVFAGVFLCVAGVVIIAGKHEV